MRRSERERRRQALIRRDGYACAYCGRRRIKGDPTSEMTFDHVVPRSRGGSSSLRNLVLACGPCNRAKSDALWVGPLVFQ